MKTGAITTAAVIKLVLVTLLILFGFTVVSYGLAPATDKVLDFFSLEAREGSRTSGSAYVDAAESLELARTEFSAFLNDLNRVASSSKNECFALLRSPSEKFFNDYSIDITNERSSSPIVPNTVSLQAVSKHNLPPASSSNKINGFTVCYSSYSGDNLKLSYYDKISVDDLTFRLFIMDNKNIFVVKTQESICMVPVVSRGWISSAWAWTTGSGGCNFDPGNPIQRYDNLLDVCFDPDREDSLQHYLSNNPEYICEGFEDRLIGG